MITQLASSIESCQKLRWQTIDARRRRCADSVRGGVRQYERIGGPERRHKAAEFAELEGVHSGDDEGLEERPCEGH